MRSTPLLIEAVPEAGHSLRVRYEDGVSASIDLSHLCDYGGVFEPLRNVAYFRRFRLDPEAGTIAWPNDADVAPETLYKQAVRASSN